MNATRLLVLGLLAGYGPLHGHQLRRRAELSSVAEWAEVRVGTLYAALRGMEADGLIAPVRREQSGNYPARTVYAITAEGRGELAALRGQALERLHLHPDPVDIAVATAAGLAETELHARLEGRRREVAAGLARYASERQRLEASGLLRPAARAVFRHQEQRLEAELRWHDELTELLPAIVADPAGFGGAAMSSEATPSDDDTAGGTGQAGELRPTSTRLGARRTRSGAARGIASG